MVRSHYVSEEGQICLKLAPRSAASFVRPPEEALFSGILGSTSRTVVTIARVLSFFQSIIDGMFGTVSDHAILRNAVSINVGRWPGQIQCVACGDFPRRGICGGGRTIASPCLSTCLVIGNLAFKKGFRVTYSVHWVLSRENMAALMRSNPRQTNVRCLAILDFFVGC